MVPEIVSGNRLNAAISIIGLFTMSRFTTQQRGNFEYERRLAIHMKGVLKVFVRFSLKRRLTALMAKEIGLVLIDKTCGRFLGIHRHFANRVDSYQGFGGPKTRLYDMGYHRRERLFCTEPPGE